MVALESPAVAKWLSKIPSESTRYVYSRAMAKFLKWLDENGGQFKGNSPDELVDYQKAADNGTIFDVLDLIQEYMLSMKGRSYNTKRSQYTALRSFFEYNRSGLPRDKTFSLRGDKPKTEKRLTVRNLHDLVLACNVTYRAVYLCMFQAGLGLSEFEYWNENGWPSLKRQLEQGEEVIKLRLPGRKTKRNESPYYSFIGKDAIQAIRDYLSKRPNNVKPIFVNQFKKPINSHSIYHMWHRQCFKIGIYKPKNGNTGNRYGFHPHLLRSLFRSQWEKSPSSGTVAEFCMGHTVDQLDYNRFFMDEDYVRRQYLLALPMLEIMSSVEPFGYIKNSIGLKVKIQEETINKQKTTITQLETHIQSLTTTVKKLQAEFEEQKSDEENLRAERESQQAQQVLKESQIPMTPEELLARFEEATAKLREQVKSKEAS